MLLQGPKKRRQVEHRSSKGRRLRYDVQEKLVNFMAPVNSAAPPIAFQLFHNLFGRAEHASDQTAAAQVNLLNV